MNKLRILLPWVTGIVLLLAAVVMAQRLAPKPAAATSPIVVRPLQPQEDVFDRIARTLPKDAPLAEVRAEVQVATNVLLSKEAMTEWSERVAAGESSAEVLRSLVRQQQETP